MTAHSYTPAWWVPGAHAQTLWGKLFRRVPTVPTRRERWPTPDGDCLDVERLDPARTSRGTPRIRLVLLHGLEGTVRSHYVQGMLAQAARRGWAADLLVFRSCGGELNTARRFYHSGETTDLSFVVRRLVAEHPGDALVLAGFSLGGNVLLKWLGEHAPESRHARAAAAVSVPFDLERGSRHIERGFSRVYGRHFLKTLRAKAAAKLEQYPDLYDATALGRARTLFDFDDLVTAPVHGFAGASDYYSRSSSLRFLAGIDVPTLLLSARDDPFLPPAVLDQVAAIARDNPSLTTEFHPHGGHVGFIAGRWPWRTRWFAEERVCDYLASAVAREERISRPA